MCRCIGINREVFGVFVIGWGGFLAAGRGCVWIAYVEQASREEPFSVGVW